MPSIYRVSSSSVSSFLQEVKESDVKNSSDRKKIEYFLILFTEVELSSKDIIFILNLCQSISQNEILGN